MLEKMLEAGLFFVRFDEVLPADAICKAVWGERNRVLLPFQAFAEILRFSPSLEDVIAFQNVCDYAGDVFGEILLMEPQGVEGDFIPGDAVDLVR